MEVASTPTTRLKRCYLTSNPLPCDRSDTKQAAAASRRTVWEEVQKEETSHDSFSTLIR